MPNPEDIKKEVEKYEAQINDAWKAIHSLKENPHPDYYRQVGLLYEERARALIRFNNVVALLETVDSDPTLKAQRAAVVKLRDQCEAQYKRLTHYFDEAMTAFFKNFQTPTAVSQYPDPALLLGYSYYFVVPIRRTLMSLEGIQDHTLDSVYHDYLERIAVEKRRIRDEGRGSDTDVEREALKVLSEAERAVFERLSYVNSHSARALERHEMIGDSKKGEQKEEKMHESVDLVDIGRDLLQSVDENFPHQLYDSKGVLISSGGRHPHGRFFVEQIGSEADKEIGRAEDKVLGESEINIMALKDMARKESTKENIRAVEVAAKVHAKLEVMPHAGMKIEPGRDISDLSLAKGITASLSFLIATSNDMLKNLGAGFVDLERAPLVIRKGAINRIIRNAARLRLAPTVIADLEARRDVLERVDRLFDVREMFEIRIKELEEEREAVEKQPKIKEKDRAIQIRKIGHEVSVLKSEIEGINDAIRELCTNVTQILIRHIENRSLRRHLILHPEEYQLKAGVTLGDIKKYNEGHIKLDAIIVAQNYDALDKVAEEGRATLNQIKKINNPHLRQLFMHAPGRPQLNITDEDIKAFNDASRETLQLEIEKRLPAIGIYREMVTPTLMNRVLNVQKRTFTNWAISACIAAAPLSTPSGLRRFSLFTAQGSLSQVGAKILLDNLAKTLPLEDNLKKALLALGVSERTLKESRDLLSAEYQRMKEVHRLVPGDGEIQVSFRRFIETSAGALTREKIMAIESIAKMIADPKENQAMLHVHLFHIVDPQKASPEEVENIAAQIQKMSAPAPK